MSIANNSAREGERILENTYSSRKWRRSPINDSLINRVNRERRAAYLRVSYMRFDIFMKMCKCGRSQSASNSSTGGGFYTPPSLRSGFWINILNYRFICNASFMGYLRGALIAFVFAYTCVVIWLIFPASLCPYSRIVLG